MIYTIISKTHGRFDIILDKKDFDKVEKLGGKWCACIKRGKPYFQKRFKGNHLKEMHRWIMGEPKGFYVDHINKNTLDNRRQNLRICTNSANLRNGKLRPNNISGFTGVFKYKDKWGARIRVKYKTIYLGYFNTFKEAVEKRKEAQFMYWNI